MNFDFYGLFDSEKDIVTSIEYLSMEVTRCQKLLRADLNNVALTFQVVESVIEQCQKLALWKSITEFLYNQTSSYLHLYIKIDNLLNRSSDLNRLFQHWCVKIFGRFPPEKNTSGFFKSDIRQDEELHFSTKKDFLIKSIVQNIYFYCIHQKLIPGTADKTYSLAEVAHSEVFNTTHPSSATLYRSEHILEKFSPIFWELISGFIQNVCLTSISYGFNNSYEFLFNSSPLINGLSFLGRILQMRILSLSDYYTMPCFEVLSTKESFHLINLSLQKISPEFSKIFKELLNSNHINLSPQEDQQTGSICFSSIPSVDPFIFMNYKGFSSDYLTLAHEVGHAIQLSQSAKVNSYFYYTPSSLLSESAAILFELYALSEIKLSSSISKTYKKECLYRFLERFFTEAEITTFESLIYDKSGHVSFSEAKDLWKFSVKSFFTWPSNSSLYDDLEFLFIPHLISEPFLNLTYIGATVIALNIYSYLKAHSDCYIFLNEYFSLNQYDDLDAFLKQKFNFSLKDFSTWENALMFLKNFLKGW